MAKTPKTINTEYTAEQDAALNRLVGDESSLPVEDDTPAYQVVGDSKIPVGKGVGKLWKQRRDDAMKNNEETFDAWHEGEDYYKNSQDSNRTYTGGGQVAGARAARQKINDYLTERENLVFSNVSAIVPALYAKAPEITVTCRSKDPEYIKFAEMCEELANAIMQKKVAPGINLKPKVKKGIVSTCLTNEAWILVGYTRKEQSSEKAMMDLQELADQYEKEKDSKKIKELEGKLQSLEAAIDILTPAGPTARLLRGYQVLFDPEVHDDDVMDANWIMYYDYVPCAALNARFAKKDKNDNWKTIYAPTHSLAQQGDESSLADTINNFKLFAHDVQDEAADDREEWLLNSTDFTKVWYVFDKTTRRVLLFHDKNWTWPIWVWDDPLHLDTFYPLHRLHFHTQPDSVRGKGEVSYYLDQVDTIAEINDAEARARQWIKRNPIYDTNIIKDEKELQKWLKGDANVALGVSIPEGRKFDEIMGTPTPDVVKFRALFDENAKNARLQAIDRIASVSDVLRGAQFKTNTTNKAIDTYNSIQNQRLDERIDAIEDWIGDIAWSILQLCVQYMDVQAVTELIGPDRAALWPQQPMPVEQFRQAFTCTITGGSTVKPTSKAKKEMAVELMQVLGQFAQAAPGPVLKLSLRIASQAFDEVVMNDQDWMELDQAIFAAQANANATGQAPGAETGQPAQQQQGGAPANGGGAPAPNPAELKQLLAQLPPQAKQAVLGAIQQGVPAQQALQEVMQQMPKQ